MQVKQVIQGRGGRGIVFLQGLNILFVFEDLYQDIFQNER